MKTGKSNFKQELKRAFLINALVPVIIVSLLVYFTLSFSLYLTLINENRNINRTLAGKLGLILDTYREEIRLIGQDQRLQSVIENKVSDISLYKKLYTLSGQTGIHCVFYILGADLRIIMSNTAHPPWYADQPNRLELGILKAAAAGAGKVVTEINKQPVNDTMLPPVMRPPITMALALEAHGSIAGFLCLDLNYNDIYNLMSNVSVNNVLTDPFANIAAASIPQFVDQKYGKLIESLQRNDQLFSRTTDHRFVSMCTLEHAGLSILTITDTGVIDKVLAYSTLFLILFIALALILNATAANIAARKTVVIDQIVAALKKVQQGDLDKLIIIESPEEFRIIGETFNQMLTDIKHLIALNAEEIRQKALAEIRQLESHFNPHFLFNTLETIRYMMAADADAANQMILNLSSLLRYSISCEKARVPLAEDIGFITHYLVIQKCRFTHRFFYEVRIDEQAMQCYVPRLAVQPLIENALKHGFGKKETLTLHITGGINSSNLIIDISDNGCGIEQGELHELRLLLECEENASGHYGLYNVHRRIRLMYGMPYGLQIESFAGEGTHISLTLPALYKEADT